MKSLIILFAAMLITGCATTRKGPQPSIIIEGRTPADVRVAVTETLLERDRKWTPVHASEMQLTFERDLPFGAQIFVQEVGAQPARHQFNFIILERTGAVQLYASLSTITTKWGNPQRNDNLSQDWEVFWLLDCIRARALGLPLPPKPSAPPQPKAASPKG